MTEVAIGDRRVALPPFNGRKVILAARAIQQITKRVPDITSRMADFARRYSQENATVITRDMALAIPTWREPLAHVTDEQWAERGGTLTIPATPGFGEQIAAVFPDLLDAAESEVLRLLALAVIPNSDLARAAAEGDVKAALGKEADRILDEASLTQLVELADATAQMIRDELEANRGPLSRLRKLVMRDPDDAAAVEDQAVEDRPVEEASDAFRQARTEVAAATPPPSSTSSPGPTDGPPSEPSTAPPGDSSLASVN